MALPLAEPSPRGDPGLLVAGYEALREAVVAGSGHGWRHGHGVLAGRGVAAWITAWTAHDGGGAGTTAQPSHPLLSASRSATCHTPHVLSSPPEVRDIYLTADPAEAVVLLDKAIVACRADDVPELASLGRTLTRWREEILNHHRTGDSNESASYCASC